MGEIPLKQMCYLLLNSYKDKESQENELCFVFFIEIKSNA